MGAASQDVDALGCMQLFQSTCAVLSACFHSDLCQLGRLVTTRALLIPPSAASLKHRVQLTACRHACRRICFGQVTTDYPMFCYFLFIISLITSASLSSCAESVTLPKILNLVYIISLHVDCILGHCKRQGENCPTELLVQGAKSYPTLPVLFLTHY